MATTTVYMYTIYSDLLNTVSESESYANLEKQRPRDALLRKGMVRQGIPDFPLPENQIDKWFPFLQQKTRDVKELHIILIYKNKNTGKDILYKVIHYGTTQDFPTQKEAFDAITQLPADSYKILSYKIDA
jgi:hypothetical protein